MKFKLIYFDLKSYRSQRVLQNIMGEEAGRVLPVKLLTFQKAAETGRQQDSKEADALKAWVKRSVDTAFRGAAPAPECATSGKPFSHSVSGCFLRGKKLA